MITGWFRTFRTSLDTWNSKLAEIWQIITQSPENFKGGDIWNVIVSIHGALQAIGYALLVLFFVVGVVKTCGSFTEVKKPEHALKLFIRFALAKGVVTYGLELMMALFRIVQGMVSTIMDAAGFGSAQETVLPQEIHYRSGGLRIFESIPLWAVTLIGGPVCHGLEFYYDHECVWTVLPAVSLYCYCPDPSVYVCRGADTERGKEFSEILCGGMSGRSHYRTGLYYLFRVRFFPAGG